jgi:hypothetical protein
MSGMEVNNRWCVVCGSNVWGVVSGSACCQDQGGQSEVMMGFEGARENLDAMGDGRGSSGGF